MATEVLATIRVGSVADQFARRGQTEVLVREAVRRVAVPEGRYGVLDLALQEMQSHSHDSKWGVVVWCGTLAEFEDGALLRGWWSAVLLAISEEDCLGVAHGVLQYGVDGESWVEVNHIQGFKDAIEAS